jgi:hypothetical protein
MGVFLIRDDEATSWSWKTGLNIKNQVDKMLRCFILNTLNGKPYNFKQVCDQI